MADLMEILKKIITSYDFEVSDEFPDHLLASKEGSRLAAAALPTDRIPTISDIVEIRRKLPEDLDRLIFVTTSEITKDVEDYVSEENLLLWDRKTLEEEIGRAVLGDMKGDLEEPGLLEEAEAEVKKPSAKVIGDKGKTPGVEIIKDGKKKPGVEVIDDEASAPSEEETIPVRIEPKDAMEKGELIMKPRVTISDVSEISKKIVQGFRFDLELIPYYVFDYSCELVVEGSSSPQINQGTLAVNGLTNSVEKWHYNFETVSELETTHTKLEPKFDENRAYDRARETAVNLNTREVQTVDDRGAVTIYEKKKVAPKEGAIEIQKRGLVYLPVWCVEGSNGVMIIDATSGKVIKEDLFREGDEVYSSGRGFSY